MIKSTLPLLFILFYFVGFSQKTIKKDLESEILSTTRQLKIYIPEGYEKDSILNYPLAIVLDEGYLFDIYVSNSILFAKKDKAPKQIVVGVSMEETIQQDTSFDTSTGKLNADALSFYQFIRDEVVFYIESTYKTSPYITLVGQGFSGNLVSHFLKENNIFINSLICINPSFSNFINRELISYNLNKFGKEDNTFYFYTNNSPSLSSEKQKKISQVHNALKNLNIENFNVINDTINTVSSISSIAEAVPRAINKIFEIYSPISKEEFDSNIKDLSPKDAIRYLENKYIELEYLFGTNLEIRKRDIYAIEGIVIEKENGDKLKDFGKMLLKLFPKSPMGEFYIGKYYEKDEKYEKALQYYKIGYGKMDPTDPNADAYYENILRIRG